MNEKRDNTGNEIAQSFIDKSRSERVEKSQYSHSESSLAKQNKHTIMIHGDGFRRDGTIEAPILLNWQISTNILTTPNPTKVKVLTMIEFDGTQCPK